MAILGVLVAASVGFGFGAAWYMWLGERWLVAVGRTRKQIEASRSPLPFVIGFAAALLTAILLRHILVSSGVTTVLGGFIAGLGTGTCLAAPWIVLNYAFANRPRDLWWIDGGHVIGAHALIGLVLGMFV